MYTAPQVVATFLDANETAGWSARSYTTETLDQVHFTVPSKLIKLSYCCKENAFLVSFEKFTATWPDYVKAIARSVHYILKTLQAGGLDFAAPDSEEAVEILVSPREGGATKVKVCII